MGKERSLIPNPALIEAQAVQEFLRQRGSDSRLIGNGWAENLNSVFRLSLLGLPLGREVDRSSLTPHERELLNNYQKNHRPFRSLTILDWDGVMDNPTRTLLESIQNPAFWQRGWPEIKERGKIGREKWRFLKDLAKASSRLVIWTSRCLINQDSKIGHLISSPFGGAITYWPFLDNQSLRRITGFGPEKIEVWTGKKPLKENSATLAKIINLPLKIARIIYYIGSGHSDRITACALAARYPTLARQFVFFDTVHLGI